MSNRYTEAFKACARAAFPGYASMHKKLDRNDFDDETRVLVVGMIKLADRQEIPAKKMLEIIRENKNKADAVEVLEGILQRQAALDNLVRLWDRGGATEAVFAEVEAS